MAALFIVLLCVLVSMVAAMRVSRQAVLEPFVGGKALKVISGINNFDAALVKNVVTAAVNGGASHVDIACDASLVRLAKSVSGAMPVCVSSIAPADLVVAVEAGADMVEIGNFDGFYEQGMTFSAEDVVAMTVETRRLLPNVPLSVTVPHTLPLHEQVALAVQLQACGADILQTEGKMGVNPASMGVQELIEKAAPTLASAFALSRAVTIPVMCASGLTDVTAPLALAAGAKGVGIGSMVNKLPKQQQMLLAVSAVAAAIGRDAAQPARRGSDNTAAASANSVAQQANAAATKASA